MAYSINKNKKKMVGGYVLIGLSLLLFVLSFIPAIKLKNYFYGVFGICWYAYLTIMLLVGFACVMNLKYRYSKKFTVFLCLTIFSFACLMHIIFSHKTLVEINGFASFKEYLTICFNNSNGVTVGGAFLGIFVYLFKSLFGIVGVYCVYIMALSIFAGIVIDSLIYGNAKKKKTHNFANNKVKEKPLLQTTQSTTNSDTIVNNIQPEEESESLVQETNLFEEETEDDNYNSTPVFEDPIYKPKTTNKSARDILFGTRDIPDVSLANDKERDRWMKNTKEELEEEQSLGVSLQDEEDDDLSNIFGNTGLNIDTEDETDNLYERNFPTRPIKENRDIRNISNSRFGAINPLTEDNETEENPRQSSRINNRNFGRNVFEDNIKLGEDTEDIAKPQTIDFSANKKPVNKPIQGKQMGIKSVRYNSIPLSIFKVYSEKNADYSEEYRRKTNAIERVMQNFNIGAKVINIVRGPKVTRYELSLPDGIPVQRVINIEKNISMALEAKSEIRIEAPIPGKNAFGIELENDVSSIVGMRELLESTEFTNTTAPLPIAIGKDINGKVIIKSLPKMVHLLVAGSTGSGKSVFIHALMMSILYKYSPEDVRFIMVDPKRVEFSMYRNLPHLMLPDVVCEHNKALNAIKWCVQEMDDRYEKLQTSECQNIEQYNKLPEVTSRKVPKMPYLVIVVDELAELMGSTYKKDFEAGIQRITQLGRAAGIHMVVATQRPSVNVITGTIKNNMPTRVAFALSSAVDSKTVLDIGGAEKLLGQGDMLFAPQDQNVKTRLQAAFCSNEEIKNALKYVKENNEATYDEDIVNIINADKKEEATGGTDALGNGGGHPADPGMDEYMKDAVKFAKNTGKVSASMLQRRFRIGFTRAARLVDQMIELGLNIGPSVGAKPRDFSITDEQFKELFGDDEDDDSIF